MTERPKKATRPHPRPHEGTRGGPSHDEISLRAYEIYLARGGNDVDNWLQAERELRGPGARQD